MDEAFVKRREEAGVKVLAKGFDAQNDRAYVVQELDSMEVIQNAMAKNQEKIMEAGVDMSTMQMIPLQDWFKQRFFPGLEDQNEIATTKLFFTPDWCYKKQFLGDDTTGSSVSFVASTTGLIIFLLSI